MITIDLGIGFSIGAVVGFIIRAIIGDQLARSRNKETVRFSESYKSSILFRAAFNPTLAQLDLARKHKSTHEAPDIDGYFLAVLPIQAEAIKGYRFFIPENKKEAYQKAWNDYYETAKGGTFVEQFVGNDDPLGFIEQKIHNILQFAKEK